MGFSSYVPEKQRRSSGLYFPFTIPYWKPSGNPNHFSAQGETFLNGMEILSVLLDSINDKLYEIFQDTVMDDAPSLVDDYIEELKEMVTP